MSFTQAIAICFRKYAVFEGRAGRAEYWWFTLFQLLISWALNLLSLPYRAILLCPPGGIAPPPHLLAPAIALALVELTLVLPTLAVTIRRLHDLDRSGWWLLLGGVPVLGWLILLIWFSRKGTHGANRFGADPLLPLGWAR